MSRVNQKTKTGKANTLLERIEEVALFTITMQSQFVLLDKSNITLLKRKGQGKFPVQLRKMQMGVIF